MTIILFSDSSVQISIPFCSYFMPPSKFPDLISLSSSEYYFVGSTDKQVSLILYRKRTRSSAGIVADLAGGDYPTQIRESITPWFNPNSRNSYFEQKKTGLEMFPILISRYYITESHLDLRVYVISLWVRCYNIQ